jgi:hypothetical protein
MMKTRLDLLMTMMKKKSKFLVLAKRWSTVISKYWTKRKVKTMDTMMTVKNQTIVIRKIFLMILMTRQKKVKMKCVRRAKKKYRHQIKLLSIKLPRSYIKLKR